MVKVNNTHDFILKMPIYFTNFFIEFIFYKKWKKEDMKYDK